MWSEKEKKNEKKTPKKNEGQYEHFLFLFQWLLSLGLTHVFFVELFCWSCIAENFVAQFDVRRSGTIVLENNLSSSMTNYGSAHGLVGCNIEAGVNAGARGRMEVSLRCYNSPRRYWVTGCGWRHAPEARVRIWREKESGTRLQTRRIDFWSSQARSERAL